jgi:hypothetical protein
MQFPDGSTYQGRWCEGAMDGYGYYVWENGNYYRGNYSNGKRHGKGLMFFKKLNSVYNGYWVYGDPRE